jgi:hypothetical protein
MFLSVEHQSLYEGSVKSGQMITDAHSTMKSLLENSLVETEKEGLDWISQHLSEKHRNAYACKGKTAESKKKRTWEKYKAKLDTLAKDAENWVQLKMNGNSVSVLVKLVKKEDPALYKYVTSLLGMKEDLRKRDFRWEYVSKEYNWDHYDMAKKQANDDCRDNHVSYEDQMKMFFS